MSPTSGQSLLITAIDFPPQIGGVATFSWEVAHSFHQLGFDVTVVTRQRDQQKINAPFKILEYSLPESGLLSVPLMRSHLKNLIEKNNFDAFFSTLWLPGGLALNLCLPQKSSHFICVHGMEIVESSQSWKKRLRKLLISIAKQQCFADATAIFCVSRFSRDLLLETLDLDPKKVHVVHNGVNPNLVSIGESSAVNSPYPLVLTACRLMPHKGIDKVLHAISFLRQEFPNIQYRIVGQGPDRERLDRIVSDLKIEAHVEFLGPVSQETLDQEYRNAHLFTMLSRQQDHHVEGFGLVFLEAALRKTASLGGDSGGVPDAIADGQTGWLVDPLDQEKINQKFLEILSDREDLEKIALKAESLTRKERTWNSSVEKMIEAMT